MRNVILFLLVILAPVEAYSQQSLDECVSLDFKPIAVSRCNDWNEYYEENNEIIYNNIYGITSLKNISDSILTFWMMTCSWTDQIRILPSEIKLSVPGCDANYPKKITLQPGQKLLLNSIVEIPEDIFEEAMNTNTNVPKPKYPTFKIGFQLIKESDYSISQDIWFYDLISSKSDSKNFVWTGPIPIRYYYYEWEIN